MAAWFLYPVTMLLFGAILSNGCKRKETEHLEYTSGMKVSVILPVYNGENKVLKKINNLLDLDYPPNCIEIIVVSDGSTDRTMDVLNRIRDPQVKPISLDVNSGKSVAQNVGVQQASNEILLFSDLDSTIDRAALRWIVPHFDNPEVGCVGTNVIFRKPDWDASGSQGLYGRIENMIRIAESRLGILASLFGSAFAVRKSYFKPLASDTGDDFIIPLDLSLRGFRTIFEPNAIVYDDWSAKSFRSEISVRRRITLRNFTGILRRRSLLNPMKFPKMAVALVLHKVLRWLSPLFLIMLFLTSFALRNEDFTYMTAFLLQVAAYFVAILGIFSVIQRKPIPVASTLGSFVVANVGMFLGLFSLLKGQRIKDYRN